MDEEELSESIRSLVNHFAPVLKDAGSVEQAEEILRNAEETDENFHKLDLVTMLNNKIENDLSMVLDKEIERQKFNDRPVHVQMQLQDRVVSNILKSSIYSDLRQEVLSHTKQAVQRLCEEYVDEEQEMMKDASKNGTMGAAASWTGEFTAGLMSSKRGGGGGTQYSFSEDSSVVGSSYNPAGFGFIGLDRFKQVISGLDSSNATEVRRNAMTNFCRINPADILDEVQNPLKSVILDALSDPDNVVASKALEYTAKLLSNSCVSLTKSVYMSFIDHVTTQFTGRRSQTLPLIKDGISLDQALPKELLIKFRLIRDFLLHVSKYWIRYPSESLMENVITPTINLLSVKMFVSVTGPTAGSGDVSGSTGIHTYGAGSSSLVTPVHFMALLDPTALWIKAWLHGAFSRVHLLTELAKNPYIVEYAVNFCMNYYSIRCKNSDPFIDSEKNNAMTPQDASSATYSANQIQFVYFVHSLNLITHILRFKKGRNIFPVVNKMDESKLFIPNLMMNLLQFVINPLPVLAKSAKKASQNLLFSAKVNYNPVELVKKMFKTLCSEELPCKSCICHNSIVEALMDPVVRWMEYSHGNTTSPTLPSKQTMVNTAEILTYIVSSKVGRKFMTSVKMKIQAFSEVSPPQHSDAKKKTTSSQQMFVQLNPCVIVRNFTVRALRAEIGSGAFESIITQPITEAYIFLCRQLYNHHDEFRLIECDDLASGLSQAWHECMRSVDLDRTPTPGEGNGNPGKGRSNGKGNTSQGWRFGDSMSLGGTLGNGNMDANNEELKWQNALLDNLLNLAATPKGVALLLQSGALNSCVNYMFGRYSKKFQVSRCEKFGYGVLVSRISSCAGGMKALAEAGFLELFVSEIWSNIECCPDDRRIAAPYVYPTEPIDLICMKSFNSLMNVLSSFPSVFELFHSAQLNPKNFYSQREVPLDVLDLLNRLVIVDNDEKMNSLFNEDQSHTFGLRLINSVCSSLDSMLLLQTQFNLQKVFLSLQAKNILEASQNTSSVSYVLDMPLVERNHFLVRISTLGGPEERILPNRELSKECTNYKHKLFHELPIPISYQIPLKTSKPTNNELSKFLQNSKNWQLDQKWASGCFKALVATLQSKQLVRGPQIGEVLERAMEAKLAMGENVLPELKTGSACSSNEGKVLNEIETYATNLLTMYGKYLKVLPESKDSEVLLQNTLKKSRQILKSKVTTKGSNENIKRSEVKFSSHPEYPSYDWFAGIVHLLFMGDTKRSVSFLENCAKVCDALCLWPACGYMLTKSISGGFPNGDILEPLMLLVANNVELVVERELPEIASAFRMSGYCPGLIAQHWLRQCFLNFLNWNEIVIYILVCFVCGVDYQIYSCVAILKHMYRKILINSQQQTLLVFLKDEPVVGFKFCDYINFMNDLRKKYHTDFLSDLRKTFLIDYTSV